MKILSALALTALLGSTAAFAQNSATTTNPNSGSSATTTENSSSSSSSTSSSMHSLKKMCKKQAKEKNLTGADKKQYIKDCEAGKTSG